MAHGAKSVKGLKPINSEFKAEADRLAKKRGISVEEARQALVASGWKPSA
jgi:hypothetical protein